MWRTSAYIDINAWEAGIAERPEDYRWCSFAAAAQGNGKARAGYAFMYGGGEWRVIRECHEQSMQEAMGEVLKAREAEKEGAGLDAAQRLSAQRRIRSWTCRTKSGSGLQGEARGRRRGYWSSLAAGPCGRLR